MNETKFQRTLQEYLKSRGFYVLKVHGDSYQRAGVPDILACYMGYFYAFECKQGSPLTAKQHYELRQIWNSGGVAMVVDSIEEVQRLLHKKTMYDRREFSNANLMKWHKTLPNEESN